MQTKVSSVDMVDCASIGHFDQHVIEQLQAPGLDYQFFLTRTCELQFHNISFQCLL